MTSIPAREAAEVFRMPIDRAFTVRGTGTVVTGTVWEGSVAVGRRLVVQPAARSARVRGVQAHGQDVEGAQPGSRAAIALAGVDVTDVQRGTWLCGDADWPVTTLMRAEVTLLADADHALRPREWVRLHLGTADVGARIVIRGGALQPGDDRCRRASSCRSPCSPSAGDRFVLRLASPSSTHRRRRGRGPAAAAPACAAVGAPRPGRRGVRQGPAGSRRRGRRAGPAPRAHGRVPSTTAGPAAPARPRPHHRRHDAYHPSALTDACDAIERLVHEEHQRNPLGDGARGRGDHGQRARVGGPGGARGRRLWRPSGGSSAGRLS